MDGANFFPFHTVSIVIKTKGFILVWYFYKCYYDEKVYSDKYISSLCRYTRTYLTNHNS